MDKLKQMHESENFDDDALSEDEILELEQNKTSSKQKYFDFYDDVKQPSKYIKEDW